MKFLKPFSLRAQKGTDSHTFWL